MGKMTEFDGSEMSNDKVGFCHIDVEWDKCRKGLSLAILNKDLVGDCLGLAGGNFSDAALSSCKESWSVYAGGSGQECSAYVGSCVDVLTNRTARGDPHRLEACRAGWKKSAAGEGGFVDACLNLTAGHLAREECRRGWLEDLTQHVDRCEIFGKLTARNPRASGVAAWVLEDEGFPFVALDARYPRECP